MAANISEKQFTVFIRLPFARGDFVDPPSVNWDAAKDQTLWDLLSRPSKDDIDWKTLAEDFGVTQQFLLQQAAWLYDRQLSQVRAQMRKVAPATQSHSNSPSPGPGSASGSLALGGQMLRAPSSGGQRAPSRQVPSQQETAQRATGIQGRRTSSTSTTTINQFRVSQDNTRTETPTNENSDPRREQMPPRPHRREPPAASSVRSPPLEEEDSVSSSEESDSDNEESGRRQAPWLKRFGHLSTHRPGLQDSEDDADDAPAFLPFTRDTPQQTRDQPSQQLSGTLRLDQDPLIARQRRQFRENYPIAAPSESSASSISSGGPGSGLQGERRGSGRLRPQRAGDPSRMSTHTTGSGREASDGTPSMGSSFSDLDDASVTQSALEEALLSNMQHGGMASRMSTISQALRSRYLQ